MEMISFALIFCTFLANANSVRSVCYFDNTAEYNIGIYKYTYENVDPMLCTHLVYSYAQISNLELKLTEMGDEYNKTASGMYPEVLKLRDVNANLKVLLAVSNNKEKPDSFFSAVETNTTRTVFARNIVTLARNRSFDGVTLEMANLAYKSNSSYNKAKYLLLLKAIRAFDADSQTSGKTRLILAVTVPAIKREIDTGYLIPEMVQQSDFISIRAFDMRTPDDEVVGLSSAFLSTPNASGDDKYLNVKWVANYYTSMGIPKAKINIGISTYGRTFQLMDNRRYQIGDAVLDLSSLDPSFRTSSVVSHYEMCQSIRKGGIVVNVPAQGGRYYVDGFNWTSYEDTLSVIQKACFIKQEGFGGITFWTLDLDDFTGQGCREGKYPIITTALRVMSSPDMSPCKLLNSMNYVKALSANTTVPTKPPAPVVSVDKMRVVCYYQSSAYYRLEECQFMPEDINPDLCTHIVYDNVILNGDQFVTNTLTEISKPWQEGLFDRFLNAQKINSALKVLLGVISGPEGKYFHMVNNQPPSTLLLRLLAGNAVSFIKSLGFHGLEFTWSQHTIEQKSLFLRFIQAFKYAIDADASKSGSPRLILAVVLPADKAKIDVYGRDIKAFEEAADFLSIRTHGFHGRWEAHTGFNSPLFSAHYESEENTYLNLDWVAKYYFSYGVSKRNINLGIPTFARTYTLQDKQYTGPYAAVTEAGMEGYCTGEPGLFAFYEVCEFIARGAKVVRDPEQRVPYTFLVDQWVSYDDVESVGEKACYARKLGFGGVGVWSLDMDDPVGISCGKGKYPLLSAIYNITQNMDNPYCSRPIHDGFEPAAAVGPSLLHGMNFNLSMRKLLCVTFQLATHT